MVVAAAGELSLAQECDSPCEKYLWDLANAEQKVRLYPLFIVLYPHLWLVHCTLYFSFCLYMISHFSTGIAYKTSSLFHTLSLQHFLCLSRSPLSLSLACCSPDSLGGVWDRLIYWVAERGSYSSNFGT